MGNVVDYVRREFHGFAELPFGDVDSLVLAELSYMRLSGLVPAFGEARSVATVPIRELLRAENYDDMFVSNSSDINEYRLALLRAVCESPRFRALRVGEYAERLSEREQQQFAAMTFDVGCGPVDSLYVAFRGTDGTLVGWKEDFNMTFQQTIPAQRLALQYARDVALADSGPLWLDGHSKGGNLAVFAAARSSPEVQQRIVGVFNNDGPGFTQYMMGDPGYLAMVPKIQTFIPQSSVIGMMLEHEEPYTVIRSKTVGLLQHDPYSWEVMGVNFVDGEEITETSQFVDATLKNRFAAMTNQERNQLVDVMYTLLSSADVERAADIFHPRNLHIYLKALSEDEQLRKFLSTEFMGFVDAAWKARAKLEQQRKDEKLLEETEA